VAIGAVEIVGLIGAVCCGELAGCAAAAVERGCAWRGSVAIGNGGWFCAASEGKRKALLSSNASSTMSERTRVGFFRRSCWNADKFEGCLSRCLPQSGELLVGTPRCGVRSAQRADPTLQLNSIRGSHSDKFEVAARIVAAAWEQRRSIGFCTI